MTKLEMDERRKNLKYYQDAKDVIYEKEQRLFDLEKISEGLQKEFVNKKVIAYEVESKMNSINEKIANFYESNQ